MEWEKVETCAELETCLNYQSQFQQAYFKADFSGVSICACSSIGDIKPASKIIGDGRLVVSIEKSLFLLGQDAQKLWHSRFPYIIYDCITNPAGHIIVVCECAVFLVSASTGSVMKSWELDIISYWEFDQNLNELTIFQNYSDDEKEVLSLSAKVCRITLH